MAIDIKQKKEIIEGGGVLMEERKEGKRSKKERMIRKGLEIAKKGGKKEIR